MLNVTARQELMSKIVDTLFVVVEDARFDFSETIEISPNQSKEALNVN
ncbi:MAG: hypothetical protein VXW28_00660 [Candidatus Thermoplasmatota archaeon]|nr:hypothetical protein [Candidatus Thermoplasmatota archaeon]